MTANDSQIGGDHYAAGYQHWDFVDDCNMDYFQAQATKYMTRWRKKNGLEDLKKALHFLEKRMELESNRKAKLQRYLVLYQQQSGISDTEAVIIRQLLMGETSSAYQLLSGYIEATQTLGAEPQPHGYVDQG